MNYNFDEIINRKGTDSVKWDGVEGRWGRNDLIPMWVADMDFRTAPAVTEALKKRSATLSFSYFPYLVPLFSTSSFLSQYTFVLHILPQNPLFDQLSLSFSHLF